MTKRQLLPATTATRSRALRKQAAEPERRLWHALRTAFRDTKFRRQVPFGAYHADFCVHSAKLVVEVDGDDHALRALRDTARTQFLNQDGYKVLRVSNNDVMRNLDGVLATIATAIQTAKGRP